MFRLDRLLSDGGEDLKFADEIHHIGGVIDGWTVLSVPETTSEAEAARVSELIKITMQTQKVLVVTHNTSFLKLTKVKPKDAAKIIKAAEDNMAAQHNALVESRIVNAEGQHLVVPEKLGNES